MANTEFTTITPASISPIFGRFLDAIAPHIPEVIETHFDSVIDRIYQEHLPKVKWQTITATEAYVTVHTLRALLRSETLSEVDTALACNVMGTLYEVLGSEYPAMFHTKSDAMARLDWVIEELESGDGPSDNDIDALKRARWAFNCLIPQGAVVDDRAKYRGPTVAQMGTAVESIARANEDAA
jgi:hypothetical protein